MQPWRTVSVLSKREKDLIHHYAMKMLAEVGAIVKNDLILNKLQEYGAKVDKTNKKVYFSNDFMENFIAESEPVEEEFDPLSIKVVAGTYGSFWMTPDGHVENFTLKTILEYIKICESLKNIDYITMPIPHDMGDLRLTPLYMRLLSWKYRNPVRNCGSMQIQNPTLIPFIIDMGKIMADRFGGKIHDYVSGNIEFQSPFHFGDVEADILVGLWKNGFRCTIGGPMPVAGMTAPVTLAGTLTQNIAETFFRSIVSRVMYDEKTLQFGCGLGTMDMRTGTNVRSAPEEALLGLALGQIVREKYRGSFRAYSLIADGMTPSFEVGFQKAMNVFNGLFAGSRYIGNVGILCSPTCIISALQLIFDNECIGFIKRWLKGFEITEDKIAFSLVKSVGAGGHFLDQTHTVENYQKELWIPSIFSGDTYQQWVASGRKTDIDKAMDIYNDIIKKSDLKPLIDEDTEKELIKVINKAEQYINSDKLS